MKKGGHAMVNSINSAGGMSSAYISQVPGRQQRGTEDLFEKIDTNSDGSVSADEFISGRPADVSEDKAKQLWSILDASNNGSMTRSQFVDAMESQGPPPGPPAGGGSDIASATNESASSSDAAGAADELVKALLAAIKQYASTMSQDGFSSANSLTSTGLLSTVV
jgi:hypothetical protein